MANSLINSTSPYLLQHAHNPVDWYEWSKEALDEAKKRDIKVALSLSDPFCVTRHKEDFINLLKGYASMVFCNQEEAFTLLDTEITQKAVETLSNMTETVA